MKRVVSVWSLRSLTVLLIPALFSLALSGCQRTETDTSEALTPQETDALLNQLPPMETSGASTDKTVQSDTPPPPSTEKATKPAFPETDAPEAGPAQAPEIVRFAPQGEVERAAMISITFSEPMIPVGRHADAQDKPLPIAIRPKVEGEWRWLDTKSLVFEPTAEALPMATEYTVRVAKDITSANGQKLSEPREWQFATAPLQVTAFHPDARTPTSNQPVLILVFNQAVEPSSLMDHLVLQANGETYALTQADNAALEEEHPKHVIDSLQEQHWVAVTPKDPLPWSQRFTLELKAGASAKHGHRATPGAQSHSFRTAGPLQLTNIHCGHGDACHPDSGISVGLSHGLAEDWDESLFTISPEVEDLNINHHGNRFYLRGSFTPNTEYTLRLKAGTEDRFGRVLENDLTTRVKVGDYPPGFSLPGDTFITLPGAHASVPIISRGIKQLNVEIRHVKPKDWQTFLDYRRQYLRNDEQAALRKPGELVEERAIKVQNTSKPYDQTNLSLKKALNEAGFGHLVLFISSPDIKTPPDRYTESHFNAAGTWIQVTNLGVSTYAEHNQFTAWVTELESGRPVNGAKVSAGKQSGETNPKGLAELPVGEPENRAPLEVINELDHALFPDHSHYTSATHDRGYYRYPTFVFTDRQLYQPRETAHFKGLVRHRQWGTDGDIRYPEEITHIEWTVYDGQSNELATDKTRISENGSFDIAVSIPKKASSGFGELAFTLFKGEKEVDQFGGSHRFAIEEFRRPEYQVHLEFSTDDFLPGQSLSATTSANYYAGGPLPNAPVECRLNLRSTHYAPPGWPGYRFGRWQPVWARSVWPAPQKVVWERSVSGQTNASGEHQLVLAPGSDFDFSELFYTHRLKATANVSDVNRQQWSAAGEILVHPGNVYVGLRTPTFFSKVDESVAIQWVAVGIDGQTVKAGTPDIIVERLEWDDGDWVAQGVTPCKPSGEHSGCEFVPKKSGNYRVTATISDKEGRENRTQLTVWVAGDSGEGFPSPKEEPEIQLIPGKEEYSPGDTARIQIQTPFAPADALLTVQRQGLVELQYQRLDEGLYTLDIPIKETSVPALTVTAEALGRSAEGEQLPQHAFNELTLPVSTDSRKLTVNVRPKTPSLKPGETASVAVTVTNLNGAAASGAELTFYAVDQSVLDLADYELPSPLNAFYTRIADGVTEYHSRNQSITLSATPPPERLEEARMSADIQTRYEAATPADAPQSTTAVRSNFSALATFESTVKLDQQGKAKVSFELPDNLTRYRLIGVAHTEQQFGTGEAQIEAGLPLMVRPSLPRFLNLGDKAELPVVVQNTTDKPMTVELAARASNLTLTGAQGRRLTIPAKDRKEVRFTAEPMQVGDATVQVIVKSGRHEDAAEVSLPVQRPATDEAFAQYGSLTGGNEFLQVSVPENVYPDFGGLSLTTSNTQFQSLSDAFLYLMKYPYGCSEQIASRLMAMTALEDLLQAFHAEGLPDKAEIEKSARDILTRLEELQNRDGGWGFWTRNGDSQAYLSVHITHALLRAREAGYDVPEPLLKDALAYTQKAGDNLPKNMETRPANSVKAYSLYVRSLAGESIAQAAIELFERTEEKALGIEAMGWLLSTVADHKPAEAMRVELLRRLNNQLRETAATASFVEDYNDGGGHWVLHGSRRTDAVVLEALLTAHPKSDLIEKLSRGLLNDRRDGHWGNTQENVFALLALKRYFLARETDVPNLTARAWLGEQFLGEHRYQGREAQTNTHRVPMSELQSGDSAPTVALQHQGQGRLYYRLGMEYAPESLRLEAARHGFQVERHYEAINDPSDVTQAKDGTWEVKAGAAVRVRLTITLPARRHHVALTDRLPAGFEALNPALATTAQTPDRARGINQTRPGFWHPHWYQHQQLRDDRAEAFSSEVEAGVYDYEYTALATTPGEFVVPPAKVEEMYHPETFARSATETVRIIETP
ncbi:alpha-2-macroglobulin family protein [Marinimicrobium locisalis]|uniref:alpha-2-macroglobulin family protein n=1 Tax=Marinimicrobium locisalis TaxID=546022 RepID=UPI003221EA58